MGFIASLLARFLAFLGLAFVLVKSGKDTERRKQAEKVVDEIHEANVARRAVRPDDELQHDPYNRDNKL